MADDDRLEDGRCARFGYAGYSYSATLCRISNDVAPEPPQLLGPDGSPISAPGQPRPPFGFAPAGDASRE